MKNLTAFVHCLATNRITILPCPWVTIPGLIMQKIWILMDLWIDVISCPITSHLWT